LTGLTATSTVAAKIIWKAQLEITCVHIRITYLDMF
jgi:hypothetical protein